MKNVKGRLHGEGITLVDPEIPGWEGNATH